MRSTKVGWTFWVLVAYFNKERKKSLHPYLANMHERVLEQLVRVSIKYGFAAAVEAHKWTLYQIITQFKFEHPHQYAPVTVNHPAYAVDDQLWLDVALLTRSVRTAIADGGEDLAPDVIALFEKYAYGQPRP